MDGDICSSYSSRIIFITPSSICSASIQHCYGVYGGFKYVEIQVRTVLQDGWSQIDHKIVYKHSNIPDELLREETLVAALIEAADIQFERIRDETKALESKADETINKVEVSTENGAAVAHETSAPSDVGNDSAPQAAHSAVISATDTDVDDVKLDMITFCRFLKKRFVETIYVSYVTTGLLEDIQDLAPDIGLRLMTEAFRQGQQVVDDYSDATRIDMTVFTKTRHILFYYDKEKFAALLNEMQRSNFVLYLEGRNQSGQ